MDLANLIIGFINPNWLQSQVTGEHILAFAMWSVLMFSLGYCAGRAKAHWNYEKPQRDMRRSIWALQAEPAALFWAIFTHPRPLVTGSAEKNTLAKILYKEGLVYDPEYPDSPPSEKYGLVATPEARKSIGFRPFIRLRLLLCARRVK